MTVGDPLRLWPASNTLAERAAVALASTQSALWAAGYGWAEGHVTLSVVEIRGEQIVPRLERTLSSTRTPTVPPALAVAHDHVFVAWVEASALAAARIDSRGVQSIPLGDASDERFSPALALDPLGATLAYTDGTATPMHVRAIRLNRAGDVTERFDLTPEGRGAAAPTFAHGEPRELYFLEPKTGTSTLYHVGFSADGHPTAATVVQPVANIYEPPRIAVVRDGSPAIAYTALGRVATTAVGVLPLADLRAQPRALLPGQAFGILGLDGLDVGDAPLFAFDAPRQSDDGWRDLRLRFAWAVEDALHISGPAARPALAHVESTNGQTDLALAYAGPEGAELRRLSCLPPR